MSDSDLLFKETVIGASKELCLLAEETEFSKNKVSNEVLAKYIRVLMQDRIKEQSVEPSKPTSTCK